MLSWLIPSFLILGAAFIPKGKMKDEHKIEKVFKSCRICVSDGSDSKYPELHKKHENEQYKTLLYTLPFGLKSKGVEAIKDEIEEALNKKIEIDYDGLLKIKVYKNNLPKKWKYTDDLIRYGTWEIPIGKNHEGIMYHDFDKYPHMLVGGVTRFGKTVFLKQMLYTLLSNQPSNINVYILDLKGGLEFNKYFDLPQVKALATNVFEAEKVLEHVVNEMKVQEKIFKANGYTNIVDTPIKKRTFIIVDEGAELAPAYVKDGKKEAANCQIHLSNIARMGGALGFRLIYCTQYPTSKSVDMSIKMNIVARLSFIAASQVASRVILDEVGAEELPAIPGRGIYKIEKQREIQVPYFNDEHLFKNVGNERSELPKESDKLS